MCPDFIDTLYIYIHTHKYIYMGRGAPNGFSGCSVSTSPELLFPPHFVKIVVEVKAS